MPRPDHYKEYDEFLEIVPGVFVDPDQGVYIVDDIGEVVCWVDTEWQDDPSAVTATVNAVILATKYGSQAVRKNLENKGQELRDLMINTYEKTFLG